MALIYEDEVLVYEGVIKVLMRETAGVCGGVTSLVNTIARVCEKNESCWTATL